MKNLVLDGWGLAVVSSNDRSIRAEPICGRKKVWKRPEWPSVLATYASRKFSTSIMMWGFISSGWIGYLRVLCWLGGKIRPSFLDSNIYVQYTYLYVYLYTYMHLLHVTGIVTLFAVVAGCVGADLSVMKIMIVAIGNLLADAISMGLGEVSNFSFHFCYYYYYYYQYTTI